MEVDCYPVCKTCHEPSINLCVDHIDDVAQQGQRSRHTLKLDHFLLDQCFIYPENFERQLKYHTDLGDIWVLDLGTGPIGFVSKVHDNSVVVMRPELRYGPGSDKNRFGDTPGFQQNTDESMLEVGWVYLCSINSGTT